MIEIMQRTHLQDILLIFWVLKMCDTFASFSLFLQLTETDAGKHKAYWCTYLFGFYRIYRDL